MYGRKVLLAMTLILLLAGYVLAEGVACPTKCTGHFGKLDGSLCNCPSLGCGICTPSECASSEWCGTASCGCPRQPTAPPSAAPTTANTWTLHTTTTSTTTRTKTPWGGSSLLLQGDDGTRAADFLPQHIEEVVGSQFDASTTTWKLLWRGTRDGFAASEFHSRCDNQGETVTVVKSTSGFVFGGVAGVAWTSSGGWVDTTKAFLFGIRTHGSPNAAVIFTLNSEGTESAMHDLPGRGPWFGGGTDLGIANNADDNRGSSSNLGCTYTGNDVIHGSPSSGEQYFAGGDYFQVAEVEVFKLVTAARPTPPHTHTSTTTTSTTTTTTITTVTARTATATTASITSTTTTITTSTITTATLKKGGGGRGDGSQLSTTLSPPTGAAADPTAVGNSTTNATLDDRQQQDEASQKKEPMSTGLVVGIAIVGLLLLSICIAMILLFCKQKRTTAHAEHGGIGNLNTAANGAAVLGHLPQHVTTNPTYTVEAARTRSGSIIVATDSNKKKFSIPMEDDEPAADYLEPVTHNKDYTYAPPIAFPTPRPRRGVPANAVVKDADGYVVDEYVPDGGGGGGGGNAPVYAVYNAGAGDAGDAGGAAEYSVPTGGGTTVGVYARAAGVESNA
eukprot:gene5850-899_t